MRTVTPGRHYFWHKQGGQMHWWPFENFPGGRALPGLHFRGLWKFAIFISTISCVSKRWRYYVIRLFGASVGTCALWMHAVQWKDEETAKSVVSCSSSNQSTDGHQPGNLPKGLNVTVVLRSHIACPNNISTHALYRHLRLREQSV